MMRRMGAERAQANDVVEPVFRLLGEGRLTVGELEALTTALQASGLPAVPPALLARAHQIPGSVARSRILVATLAINQHPWMAAVGMRGGARGISRQVFEIDDYEVVVQGKSRHHESGHEVTGQVLCDGDPVASAAVLLAGDDQRAETEADDDGSFRFAGGILGGSYELDVWAGNDLIVCVPVLLGARG